MIKFIANQCIDKLDTLVIYRWHIFLADMDDEPIDIQYRKEDGQEIEIFAMNMDYVHMLDGHDPLAYCFEKIKENMARV